MITFILSFLTIRYSFPPHKQAVKKTHLCKHAYAPRGEPLPLLWSDGTPPVQVISKSPGSPVREEVLVSHTSKTSSNLLLMCPARLLLPQGSQTLATLIGPYFNGLKHK